MLFLDWGVAAAGTGTKEMRIAEECEKKVLKFQLSSCPALPCPARNDEETNGSSTCGGFKDFVDLDSFQSTRVLCWPSEVPSVKHMGWSVKPTRPCWSGTHIRRVFQINYWMILTGWKSIKHPHARSPQPLIPINNIAHFQSVVCLLVAGVVVVAEWFPFYLQNLNYYIFAACGVCPCVHVCLRCRLQ